MSDSELFEQSVQIAWDVLERSGDLRERNEASQFLCNRIAGMMNRGERRRLALTNLAIDAYRATHPTLTLVS
jgi:hypothetical protein